MIHFTQALPDIVLSPAWNTATAPSAEPPPVFGPEFAITPEAALPAVGAANEIVLEPGATAADWAAATGASWLTVPHGEYPHDRGTQVVDAPAATAMAQHFKRIWARLTRGLRGLPVYVGHPDAVGRNAQEQAELAHAYPDQTVYGWITLVEATESGLELEVRWTPAGLELVAEGEFSHFSPHWGMQPLEGEPGRYRPVELYSLGLTNQPNIPALSLVNEAEAPCEDPVAALKEPEPSTLAAPVEDSAQARLRQEAARLETALNEERRARCTALVDRALEEGRIPLAARNQWLRNLELDTAGNEALLRSLPAAWNNAARNPVRALATQRGTLEHPGAPAASSSPTPRRRPDRVERIAREITRRQQQEAEPQPSQEKNAPLRSFHELYHAVKKDHPEWFQEG